MTGRRIWLLAFSLLLLAALLAAAGGAASASAQAKRAPLSPRAQAIALLNTAKHRSHGLMLHGRVTPAQRAAAVAEVAEAAHAWVMTIPVTSTVPDYWGPYPNWARSPLGLNKFIDPLPDLVPAKADKATFPGSDYYELAVVQFTQKLHTNLANPATLRGYVQIETAATGVGAHVPLYYPNGTTPITNSQGAQVYAYAAPTYLGPMIVAQRGTPVRFRVTNYLPTGAAGNLFVPVDTTMMGAGMGPNGAGAGNFTQNRTVVHLHGGDTVWISDGTPNQWITPAAETSVYKKGVSVQNVPDMMFNPTTHVALGLKSSFPAGTTDPGPGSQTYFYTNNESARLMWFHDHALGITRLNVYVGMVAAYLLQDTQEAALVTAGVAAGGLPADQIPLVIQDKAFLPNAASVAAQDPTWKYLPGMPQAEGSLWFPHVYMPNQNPYVNSGAADMGRWDYGPWFWPIFGTSAGLVHDVIPNIYAANGEPAWVPGTPNPSIVPEAFMDTMMVNGKAYPFKTVSPKPYRLRILNGSNDRFLNLQMYTAADGGGGSGASGSATVAADGTIASVTLTGGGGGYTEAPGVWITPSDGIGGGAMVEATLTAGTGARAVAALTLTGSGSGFTVGSAPVVTIGSAKEVKMVQACPDDNYPARWPTDGRAGGVPDPTSVGPDFIQVGTEGGFLPAPVDLPNTPVGYNYNRRDIVVLNVANKTLFLGPAERADAVVDFSAYAGKTVVLYNDAPAPVPAFDPRNDYYTAGPDNTAMGGAPSTLVGMGPSTRTIMVFKVSAGTPAPLPANYLTTLTTNLGNAYVASQPKPIVPQSTQGYPAPYAATTDTYSRIQDNNLDFIPVGATLPIHHYMEPKAIQELFELNYGRMNATLGVELPFTNAQNQTTIPLGYIDPGTESILGSDQATQVGSANDGTQIWKITHNGVDTHAIHFHLFNVQIINRVGWDGAIRPPDPNEIGWKETVRMNPLEDCIVALRPIEPALPFKVGDSIRPEDPTVKVGDPITVADPTTGNLSTIPNPLVNFGWEYVWHCHLLGHEENDMMRPVAMQFSPATPTALTAAFSMNPLLVNLAWIGNATANPPTTSYLIQRSTDSLFSGTPTEFSVSGAATVTYADATVFGGTDYYYRVRAENVSAYSAWSNVAFIHTPGRPPLVAPTNLVAAVTQAPFGVGLTWTNNAGTLPSTGVAIQRATDAGFTLNVTAFSAAAAAASYADLTVASGTTYWYRVRAVAGGSVSPWSNAVSVTPVQALAAPTALTAVAAGPPLQVNLAWVNNAPAPPATGITVQRATDAGFTLNVTTFPSIAATSTSYADTTAAAGTTYYYHVRATGASATFSAWSNTASLLTPTPTPAPAAPTNLRLASRTNSALSVAWTNNGGATSNVVQLSTAGTGGPWTTRATLGATATTYTVTGLRIATNYWVRILATNASGQTSSNVLAARTL